MVIQAWLTYPRTIAERNLKEQCLSLKNNNSKTYIPFLNCVHWRLHTRPSTSSTSIWVLTLVHSHGDCWWPQIWETQVKWQSWSSSQDEAQLQTAMFCWYTAHIITTPAQPYHVNCQSWLPGPWALRWCQVAQTNLWQVSHSRQDRLQFACHVHGRMQWHDVWHSCWWFKKSLDDTECFPLAK